MDTDRHTKKKMETHSARRTHLFSRTGNSSKSLHLHRRRRNTMAWRIRSRARSIISAAAAAEFQTAVRRISSSSSLRNPLQHWASSSSFNGEAKMERFQASGAASVLHINCRQFSKHGGQDSVSDLENVEESGDDNEELFDDIKQRFLSFKKNKFLKAAEHYRNLANIQSPKFVVIGCADSRVCPSNILGFKPGEAFMIRNVTNLVPHSEFGPSETSAALEFAVKSLQVKNILVIGHSRCAGIEALMSMNDNETRNYTDKWIINGKVAKLRTKSVAAHRDFYKQCKHCEKESVNESLKNLLTYPWIEERYGKGEVSLYGGYYDFVNCTFEKWTLYLDQQDLGKGHEFSIRNRAFWC